MLAEMNCDVGSEQMKPNARINPSHSSYLPPLSLSSFLSCFLSYCLLPKRVSNSRH